MLIVTQVTNLEKNDPTVIINGTVKNEVEFRDYVSAMQPGNIIEYSFTDDGIGASIRKPDQEIGFMGYEALYGHKLIKKGKLTHHAQTFNK